MALRIIIDTMHIAALLSGDSYMPLARAIDEGTIEAVVSVVGLTELTKILGRYDAERAGKTISRLK